MSEDFVNRWAKIAAGDVTSELNQLGITSHALVVGDSDKGQRVMQLNMTVTYAQAAELAEVIRLGRETCDQQRTALDAALDTLAALNERGDA